MLTGKEKARAKKYAIAFLNLFGSQMVPEDIERIADAAAFLSDHRRAVFLLKVPVIPEKIKKEGLQDFCDRFGLKGEVARLINVLLAHKLPTLLLPVLEGIVAEYNRRRNQVIVTISSAVALDKEQKKILEQFADEQFPGKKTYQYRLDKTLIAGVRLQSETMMWEYSIDNYLRNCARAQVW